METKTETNSLGLRYGEHDQPATFAWNETINLLLNHRSVRGFLPQALPEGTLEAMIAAAQSAATSSNLQAWSVVAVTDPDRKARLAQLAGNQGHIRDCPLFLVWLADLSRLERIAAEHKLPADALDYMEMLMLAVIDAGLAAQNAVTAAESLGLGTVYIGGIRNQPLAIAAELGLPSRSIAVFGMCVGWPDPERLAAVKPRLPQATVLHHERYSVAQEPDLVERYNQTMAAFYAEQQMRTEGVWAEHSAKRVAGPQSLSGRHVLREALERLGFAMR